MGRSKARLFLYFLGRKFRLPGYKEERESEDEEDRVDEEEMEDKQNNDEGGDEEEVEDRQKNDEGEDEQALRNSCELLRQRKELHTSS